MSFHDEDRELVALAREGDEIAFKGLVDRYYNVVCSRVYFFLDDPDEAQDLTQEIFLDIFRCLRYFRGDSTFFTWMYQIINRKAKSKLSYLIKRRHINVPISEEDDTDADMRDPPVGYDPETICLEMQLQEQLEDTVAGCLNELKPLHKELLVLKYMRDLSIHEICDKLNLSRAWVRRHLSESRHEIRELLRAALDPDYLPDPDQSDPDENEMPIAEEA